jgi:hypothetical protein
MHTAYWLQSTLQRVFPRTPAADRNTIDLVAARGERVSFQACVRNLTPDPQDVRLAVVRPQGVNVIVRRVGYVPMPHHNTATEEGEQDGIGHIPGYVPDPLFPEQDVKLGPWESHAFWVTVVIPPDAKPGLYDLDVRFTCRLVVSELKANITVGSTVLKPHDHFPVTHWFYADALCDYYGIEPFDDRFWAIARNYMRDLAEHGVNCQYVPLFTPPTDGVKRPTQLLKVSQPAPGTYYFDFSNVRRWVRMAQECGARWFEWTHLFTQWGVQNAIRVYRNNNDPKSLLWPPETGATSDVYRGFLADFLPQFYAFLQYERLYDCSFFHLSDEPGEQHFDNYRAARNMLKEIAPWLKVSDALSDVRYGREGLTDNPIPSIEKARDYAEAGMPGTWVYFCCGPRGRWLNRLMDTPLAKIRMTGWLFHRLNAKGFLHWGYNYWYKSQTQTMIDPFAEGAAMAWPGWAYGDPFEVYPGTVGPIDSIRWEVFGESLQDYALLQTLGLSPDDERLSAIKGYDEFPKTPEWIEQMRRALLA